MIASHPIYERNINSTVYKKGNSSISVRTSLLDLDHNIVMELVVDIKNKTIKKAHCEMIKVPRNSCDQALKNAKNLIGLVIEKGISKNVAKVIGGDEGCTHLVEIAMSGIRTCSNTLIALELIGHDVVRVHEESKIAFDKAREKLKGTCVAFK
jgi:hypothetical protein